MYRYVRFICFLVFLIIYSCSRFAVEVDTDFVRLYNYITLIPHYFFEIRKLDWRAFWEAMRC